MSAPAETRKERIKAECLRRVDEATTFVTRGRLRTFDLTWAEGADGPTGDAILDHLFAMRPPEDPWVDIYFRWASALWKQRLREPSSFDQLEAVYQTYCQSLPASAPRDGQMNPGWFTRSPDLTTHLSGRMWGVKAALFAGEPFAFETQQAMNVAYGSYATATLGWSTSREDPCLAILLLEPGQFARFAPAYADLLVQHETSDQLFWHGWIPTLLVALAKVDGHVERVRDNVATIVAHSGVPRFSLAYPLADPMRPQYVYQAAASGDPLFYLARADPRISHPLLGYILPRAKEGDVEMQRQLGTLLCGMPLFAAMVPPNIETRRARRFFRHVVSLIPAASSNIHSRLTTFWKRLMSFVESVATVVLYHQQPLTGLTEGTLWRATQCLAETWVLYNRSQYTTEVIEQQIELHQDHLEANMPTNRLPLPAFGALDLWTNLFRRTVWTYRLWQKPGLPAREAGLYEVFRDGGAPDGVIAQILRSYGADPFARRPLHQTDTDEDERDPRRPDRVRVPEGQPLPEPLVARIQEHKRLVEARAQSELEAAERHAREAQAELAVARLRRARARVTERAQREDERKEFEH